MRPRNGNALPGPAGQGAKTTEGGNLKTHLAMHGASTAKRIIVALATRGFIPAGIAGWLIRVLCLKEV